MALTINQNKIEKREFFENISSETIEKLSSINNQAVKYQNMIASLSTVQDTAFISKLFINSRNK